MNNDNTNDESRMDEAKRVEEDTTAQTDEERDFANDASFRRSLGDLPHYTITEEK